MRSLLLSAALVAFGTTAAIAGCPGKKGEHASLTCGAGLVLDMNSGKCLPSTHS